MHPHQLPNPAGYSKTTRVPSPAYVPAINESVVRTADELITALSGTDARPRDPCVCEEEHVANPGHDEHAEQHPENRRERKADALTC